MNCVISDTSHKLMVFDRKENHWMIPKRRLQPNDIFKLMHPDWKIIFERAESVFLCTDMKPLDSTTCTIKYIPLKTEMGNLPKSLNEWVNTHYEKIFI